jgi:hypothetical protein
MADSPDRRSTAEGDRTEDPPAEAAEGKDAKQQEETPAAVPQETPRRPRLYGYDPDQWPDQT